MKKILCVIFWVSCLMNYSCGSLSEIDEVIENDIHIIVKDSNNSNGNKKTIKILSLGDSYTIGQSVCQKCSFPSQLVDSLLKRTENKNEFPLKIIARTGWTTTNLINAIKTKSIDSDYNFVTLLIGVNNQYQNKSFSIYKEEFPKLIDFATEFVGRDAKKLVVLSIPDYAFTPFGKGNTTISYELKRYNDFAKSYCNQKDVTFLNITDITKTGLTNPTLVAADGLHPSKKAYSKFVERLTPIVLEKLNLK